MLIHLLIALMSKKRDRAELSAPTQFRNIADDPVALDCPHCGKLVVAQHDFVQELIGLRPNAQWTTVTETYKCPECQKTLIAENFENDGRGVLRVKTWNCQSCRVSSPVTSHRCTNCRKVQPFVGFSTQ